MLRLDRARMAFTMALFLIAGVAALVLGLVGIYGVIAFAVNQRTSEIGVRMALGARPGDVTRMVLRQGGVVTAVGLLAGVATGLGASRLIGSVLFGVSATDPVTYVTMALALPFVSLAACWLPARRAARTDPVEALRARCG
ncbi:MAG TPA: FtsX-like permease family protein [Longimicrobiales bacterium]|nr:FtsX-like permease family protein [Longimicrobiales bacterium]